MGAVLDAVLNSTGTNVAGGLLNNIINGIAARKRLNREFKQLEKMLNLENAFTEKMWNMQNAYNDPSKQMERLTNAGINPIDAASGVSGNAGNSASVSSNTAPSVPTISNTPLMTENLGEAYNQGRLIATQIDALAAQAKLTQEQALTQLIENSWKPIEKYLNRETMVANMKNLAAQYNLTSAQTKSINFDVDKLFPEKVRFTKAQADNMEASTKLTLGQVAKNNEEIENLKKLREEIAARIAEANQSTDLMAALEEGVNAQTQLSKDEHDLKEVDKRIKSIEEDNAKLLNDYKHNLSDEGYSPDLKFDFNSPAGVAHGESVRRTINKMRTYKDKVKLVELWNRLFPSQPMKIDATGNVVFVNNYKSNKKLSPYTAKPKGSYKLSPYK